MVANEIIKNVWVGDIDDAEQWKGNKICVLETYPHFYENRKNSVLIPILQKLHQNVKVEDAKDFIGTEEVAMMENLDLISSVIQNHVMAGEKVLVHCMGGIERSLLAVTWYLHKNAGVPVSDAFDFVKKKRPQAMNRIQWLNISYDEL